MSIYIYQSAEQVKNSFNVQKRAEIVSVRLHTASVDSHPQPTEILEAPSISVGHECNAEMIGNQALLANVDFALIGATGANSTKLFSLKCKFQVVYQIEDGYHPTPDEIAAFAGANGVFNAWPYFREFAQSTCARIGLSTSPLVPFLKLALEQKAPQPSDGQVTTGPSIEKS